MGFDEEALINAFGAVLGQLSGTMQAHSEGSLLLALQIGFNARNAVVACDLAANGLVGPRHLLEGPFGYFPLFEGDYDLAPVLRELGKVWRVGEVALKPFPSGRATHGVLDGVLALMQEHRLRRGRRGADRGPCAALDAAPGRAPGACRDDRESGSSQRALRRRLRAARGGRRRRRLPAGRA